MAKFNKTTAILAAGGLVILALGIPAVASQISAPKPAAATTTASAPPAKAVASKADRDDREEGRESSERREADEDRRQDEDERGEPADDRD